MDIVVMRLSWESPMFLESLIDKTGRNGLQ